MLVPEYRVVEPVHFDLQGVARIVREADILCAQVGIGDEGFDPYELASYRVQEFMHGNTASLVIDLNVLRRLNSLHPRSGRDNIGKQERLVAALMAFSIFGHIKLNPMVAFREWLTPGEEEKLKEQLYWYQQLDNVDPAVYADLALGKLHRLREEHLLDLDPIAFPDLTPIPPYWDFDYTALLKVASLVLSAEREGTAPAAAMEEFLRWSWGDFLFSSPAIQFGGLHLSPRRLGKMFKGLRSGDPDKALAGLRNATWDLAYMRMWAMKTFRQKGTTEFHLFCSLDRALRESAREFLVLGDGLPPDALERLWKRLWGESDGEHLLEVYEDLARRQDDPQRPWNQGVTTERAEEIKAELEQELVALVRRTGSES